MFDHEKRIRKLERVTVIDDRDLYARFIGAKYGVHDVSAVLLALINHLGLKLVTVPGKEITVSFEKRPDLTVIAADIIAGSYRESMGAKKKRAGANGRR